MGDLDVVTLECQSGFSTDEQLESPGSHALLSDRRHSWRDRDRAADCSVAADVAETAPNGAATPAVHTMPFC